MKHMLSSALIAGFAAGLIFALLQFVFLQPDIVLAEQYESGALTHFSGVAPNGAADDHAHNVFIVNGAPRTKIAKRTTSGVDWGKVVFHCFTEGPLEMAELMQRGGYGSFTGVITYKSAEQVRAAALAQGLGRLMIETDAPYLTPMPHRGKPNEPAYLRHTAEFCAGVFGVSYDELAAITTRNAKGFYGI